MINLKAEAYVYTQYSRIEWAFKQFWTGRPADIGTMIGTVLINADMWDKGDLTKLVRASNDSELGSKLLHRLLIKLPHHIFAASPVAALLLFALCC